MVNFYKLLSKLKNKIKLNTIIMTCFGIVFVYSSYMFAHKAFDYYKSEKLYSELKEKYSISNLISEDTEISEIKNENNSRETTKGIQTSVSEDGEILDIMDNIKQSSISKIYKYNEVQLIKKLEEIERKKEEEYQKQLAINIFEKSPELLKINKDIVGWIRIPHSNVDYPVVKTVDNDFYLKHDFRKREDSAGCIYMDFRDNGKFSDMNTILYGHNMKNQTMFYDITKYKERDFFDTNRIIYIYTPNGVQRWVVFSVYVTDVNFNYIIPNFPTSDEFQQFINEIRKRSFFRSNATVSSRDKILTLSTCSYEFTNARTVVHAKLLK